MVHEGLFIEKASKSFDGIRVVKSVDLHIAPGEVIALLGENGAGKSVFLKLIAGIHHADEVTMTMGGRPVIIKSVRSAREHGIAIVHQELNLAGNRTVAQNVFLGREPRLGAPVFGIVDRRKLKRDVQIALDLVGSTVSQNAIVGTISLAQQQQVEIAKALSQSDVSILLLDEPTSSLPEEQATNLLALIRRLCKRGLSVVITTHRLDEAFAVADRIVIMRDGENVAELRAGDDGVNKDSVIEKMVGRKLTALFPSHRSPSDVPLLEVDGLSGGVVKDVSFTVNQGEIFGLGGLVGAGRTETVRRIFGADKSTSRSIRLNGEILDIKKPRDAVRLGIGFIPEDRKADGLVQMLDVQGNIALPNLRNWSALGVISLSKVREAAARFIGELSIKARSSRQIVSSLSGGNQQKVVLAKWMAQPLKLLILDEPTRGVDVGARAEIYRHIDAVAARGIGVLLVSSDMEELIGLSDRIGVMAEGRLTGILRTHEISQEAILALASQLESVS